jgi:hypothetical protein
MERRAMIAIPGIAALVASRAFGQAEVQNTTRTVTTKSLTSRSGVKSAYKIPKSAKKVAKFVNTLSAMLALTPSQQQNASAIFTAAASSHTSIKTGIKPLHVTLAAAVRKNDTVGISQTTASLSLLSAQKLSNGALANAAFFQILTPAQQATLAQFTA